MQRTIVESTIVKGALTIKPDDARMLLHTLGPRLPALNFISPLSHRLEDVASIDEFWWSGARSNDREILELVAPFVWGGAGIVQEWTDGALTGITIQDGVLLYGLEGLLTVPLDSA